MLRVDKDFDAAVSIGNSNVASQPAAVWGGTGRTLGSDGVGKRSGVVDGVGKLSGVFRIDAGDG